MEPIIGFRVEGRIDIRLIGLWGFRLLRGECAVKCKPKFR